MLSHGSKAHDKHRSKSGPQGLWTQSKFVVSELQARLRPVEAAAPPRLLVELRADEMIAVRNWTLFRECLADGPAGDVDSETMRFSIFKVVKRARTKCFGH